MANITTYDLFIGDINLPNVDPNKPTGEALDTFISKYEQKLLSEVLGYSLAKDLLAAFNDDPQPAGVLMDIVEGKEYTDKHGRLNKWPGFETEGYSALANYIFCMWCRDAATYTSSNGEKQTASSNSQPASAAYKVVQAWNDMVDWLYILDDFLTQNSGDYPDYTGINPRNKYYFTKTNVLGI